MSIIEQFSDFGGKTEHFSRNMEHFRGEKKNILYKFKKVYTSDIHYVTSTSLEGAV